MSTEKTNIDVKEWDNFSIPLTGKNISLLKTKEGDKEFVIMNTFVPSFFDEPSFVNISFNSKDYFFEGKVEGNVEDKTQKVIAARTEDNKKIAFDFSKLSNEDKGENDSIPVCLNYGLNNKLETKTVYVSKKNEETGKWEDHEEKLDADKFKKLLSAVWNYQTKLMKSKSFGSVEKQADTKKTNEKSR